MGIFGNEAYKPAASLDEATTQAPEYDVSGIAAGKKKLDEVTYTPEKYNAYQFSTPSFGGLGSYGKTSPEAMSGMYKNVMGAVSRPAIAQGSERMRQMSQGFEGGRPQGAAGRELAMKNAQATGAQLSDIGSSVGQSFAEKSMGQDELAREREWQDKGEVRNTLFKAEQDKQLNQATENFRAAGFNDQQARQLAAMNMSKATTMFDVGMKIPQLQSGLWQNEAKQGNQLYDYAWGGASYA